MFAHGETVTRLRALLIEDPYSSDDTEPDWENPYSLDIPGCAFDPGGSSDITAVDRDGYSSSPQVFAPFGADILATDRLAVRGKTYQIVGEVAEWRSPFTGWEPGIVVKLERADG